MTAPTVIDFVFGQPLGASFKGDSWAAWRVVLKASFAIPLDRAERRLFRAVAGHRKPPSRPVRELSAIVGRGGGKDSIAAGIAAYVAATGDFSRLRPGERATILCLATDRDQAGIAFKYILGSFQNSPILAALVTRVTADTIELANGAEIIVGTNSYRSVRGKTIVCAIYDECAFWNSEDYSNPDVEVDAAISPGLARYPGALKIMISSAHKKSGLLYQRWKEYYGRNDDDVLAVLGDTITFNPTFDKAEIARKLKDDPDRFGAEYLCRWRDDLASFIDREAVEACIERGCRERGPLAGISYQAFVDMSGGRADSSVLAIGHADGEGRGVLDVIRERNPPFSPEQATAEFAATCKIYGIGAVVGDQYAGDYPGDAFRRHGITYEPAPKPRSGLYLDLLALLNSGRVVLLDNERLIGQLCTLERRVERSGRESVNHPDRGHDDVANSAAGVLTLVAGAPRFKGWSVFQYYRQLAEAFREGWNSEPEVVAHEPDLALIEAARSAHPDVPIDPRAYEGPIAVGCAPGSVEHAAAMAAGLVQPTAMQRAASMPSGRDGGGNLWVRAGLTAPPPLDQRCRHGVLPGACRACLMTGRYGAPKDFVNLIRGWL